MAIDIDYIYMGEPEAIDNKFAHVHSECVWWLSVIIVVTCSGVMSVCVHVHAFACAYTCVHVYVLFIHFLYALVLVHGMYILVKVVF